MSTDYLAAREKAWLQYEAAFHLLHVTFPLVNDPRLLMGIVTNMFTSLESAMDAILRFERQLRLVSPYNETFTSKFNLFRYKSVRRNKIDQSYINLIIDLREILELHKKSPVEFKRGSKFVICGKDYRLKYITARNLKSYLDKTKGFLEIMDRVINRK